LWASLFVVRMQNYKGRDPRGEFIRCCLGIQDS
jgi:hypothetical protein